VYLNTIPIRNLSHRIKNGNRENRQPVEPKNVKQHKATKIKLTKICGGNCPGRGAIVLLPHEVPFMHKSILNILLPKTLKLFGSPIC
jgi:hypothetical protein